MHILIGALIGAVVSVALTFAASRVINKPLTWKDIAASAAAGIVGGAVATATLGVGAAGTLRTVAAFAAGGATGSASGQITDNVLYGHPIHENVVKSTAFGTAIGAATLGVGKAAAPLARHAARAAGFSRGASAAASAGHGGHGGHGNMLAGAAAGLDDAIVPVVRYVKKALAADDPDAASEDEVPEDEPEDELGAPIHGGALAALEQATQGAHAPENAPPPAQTRQPMASGFHAWAERARQTRERPRQSEAQSFDRGLGN